nr:hypothetical protein [uncultured Treponema sp.]
MKGSATVTPSTGGEQWMQGKNDVFLPVNAEITIEGNLIPVDGGEAARITPQRYATINQVLDGAITTGSNYTKFTVTPNGTELWEIGSNGKLKRK